MPSVRRTERVDLALVTYLLFRPCVAAWTQQTRVQLYKETTGLFVLRKVLFGLRAFVRYDSALLYSDEPGSAAPCVYLINHS